jgi:hypothetical protein
MTTISFHPSEAFLADAIAHEDVKTYITAHLFREKVYMITRVMIAASTTVIRECIEAKGLFIHAGVDATSWAGVPISVGPEGKWKRQTNTAETGLRQEEFVFAYRLREIKVRRKGGVKAHRLYDKGALFSTEREPAVDSEEEIHLVGLGDGDVDGDELGLDVKQVEQECDNGVDTMLCILAEDM